MVQATALIRYLGNVNGMPAAEEATATVDQILAGATGAPFLPLAGGTLTGLLTQIATATQPTTDKYFSWFNNTVTYTGDSASGDSQGVNSQVTVLANGHSITPQHIAGVTGQAYLGNDSNASGTITWINGSVFESGNQGPGTVTNAVDVRGHADLNSGGGTLTNHYFLYQEPSSAATHEYGGYLSAPLGIGQTAPTYNLDVNSVGTGGLSSSNWLRAGSGNGTLLVTSTGATLFPGYNPGAGGLGVTDLVVGNGGNQNPTTASTNFLFISSCAGTPTGVPTQAAVGRIPVQYDTSANKIWFYNGSWRGVLVT